MQAPELLSSTQEYEDFYFNLFGFESDRFNYRLNTAAICLFGLAKCIQLMDWVYSEETKMITFLFFYFSSFI